MYDIAALVARPRTIPTDSGSPRAAPYPLAQSASPRSEDLPRSPIVNPPPARAARLRLTRFEMRLLVTAMHIELEPLTTREGVDVESAYVSSGGRLNCSNSQGSGKPTIPAIRSPSICNTIRPYGRCLPSSPRE